MTPRFAVSLAALLVLAVCAISALPTETKHAMHLQGALHPWLHLFAFSLLALLLLTTSRSIPLRLVLIAALLLFGYATEAYESHNDGWPIEQKDVRTDAAGVLLGSIFSLIRIPRRKP